MNLLHLISGQHSAFPRGINDRILMALAEIPGIGIVGGMTDRLYRAFFAQTFTFVGFMLFQQVSYNGIGIES
jgi:hypothetical protein